MKLTCPVCGFGDIEEPKLKWSICPSCGTQFGLSDQSRSYAELRSHWIQEQGAAWQSEVVPKPPRWSPERQLRQIGYECTAADLQRMGQREPVPVG